ncbi:MAG: AraC family transcriptional regulator, partial [Comamonadaceae bacterium]
MTTTATALAPAPQAAPAAVRISAFSVAGIGVRTSNNDEVNPAIARLGGLWGRFFSESWERKLPGRGDDGRIYGVYSGYESNEHGAFDVTAQAVPGAVRVDIEAGDYLVFTGQGDMPQMVIDTWV